MKLEPVERIGWTEQDRLDEWFDAAMRDETVRPYLTTGTEFPRLHVPEEPDDGVVLMNKRNTGVVKLYFSPQRQAVDLGIWVLESDLPKRVTSLSLMTDAMVVCQQYPLINYMAARVMSTNERGLGFAYRLFNDSWGTERMAVLDTSRTEHSKTGGWTDWVHFRERLDTVKERVYDWKAQYEE